MTYVTETSAEETASRAAQVARGAVDATRYSIQIKGLSKRFRRKGGEMVQAVDDVSLDIPAGEMVVLLGPSGCGKTSLLRCIGGLEQSDSGEIFLAGKRVVGPGQKPLPPEARGIGMMFQSYALWPHMTVAKNVSYPLEARGVKREQATKRVDRILGIAGVAHLARQYPGNLSGGQQQRVALVRSLVAEPEIILFDEPLSNVDAKVRMQLRAEIRGMQQRLGFAGIYVTHDQEEALQLADRVAVMRAGRIVEMGKPDELYNRPRSRYVAQFLGELNLVPVDEFNDTHGHVEVPHPDLGTIYVASSGPVALTDGPSVLGFRPERLNISKDPGPESAMNHWEGVVERVTFSGPSREYSVRIGENAILTAKSLEGASTLSVNQGDSVHVWVDPEDVLVLVDDIDDELRVVT